MTLTRQSQKQVKPEIRKLGTIDCDLVETTPIVFKGVLYRFEYVRERYKKNYTGTSYFRFVEHDTGRCSRPFAQGWHLGNVMVVDDTLYVTGSSAYAGTSKCGGDRVNIFSSKDMENWESWTALNLPGYKIYNTSLCPAEGRYVLMFEISEPKEITGVPFTAQFAFSDDLKTWELMPPECNYEKDRYTAPHCLRYLDGYYYNFYLEAFETGFEQYVVRSKDLIHWESSPLNPVLKSCDEDRKILNPELKPCFEDRIKRVAVNCNNSDIDFCEYNGKLIINYSWGSQVNPEHIAEAVYDGTMEEFLRGWFPA